MNPFTQETRSDVVSTHLPYCGKLRMPSSIRHLLQHAKPAHVSIADFLLKGALDAYLLHEISCGHYVTVQTTLAVLFGPEGNDQRHETTVVPFDHRKAA